MVTSELADVISTEGRLHGVNSWVLFKLIEEGHPSSGIFGLLVAKATIIIDEERADVRQNEGEEARVFWLPRYVTTVHENILPPTMTVHVTE
jgi:hypothetical protein